MGKDTKTAEIRTFANRFPVYGDKVATSEHHLDVTQETENFLKHFERLSRLPLITDAEMANLFRPEVISVLTELDHFSQREKVCSRCNRRCCLLVDCELYTPELSICPIHSYRPLLCRMHFCNQFARVYPSLVKEVGDIFLESLIAAERQNKSKTAVFDSPPLGKYIPNLVAAIKNLLGEFKKGRLDEPTVLRLIQVEIDENQYEHTKLLSSR